MTIITGEILKRNGFKGGWVGIRGGRALDSAEMVFDGLGIVIGGSGRVPKRPEVLVRPERAWQSRWINRTRN